MINDIAGLKAEAYILVVDDELPNLKLVERMLLTENYEQIACLEDPRQVVACYRKRAPDLIVLDLNMPYLDGFQTMAQLQALDDPLLPPILVLTAQHEKSYCHRALAEGAKDYLTKPFDRVELLMRVRNLLEIHHYHRDLRERNDVLEAKVRERTLQLHETRLQVVRRLGRAAEYHDNETGLHIIRMSQVATLLGEALGMNTEWCDLLLNASPMHDIGKIGIPDRILQKPGKLDPGEWEIMKTHTLIGAEILAGDESDLLRLAREIALTHHEKWNGKGYPNGLAGKAIPLTGRICAVADVFDALITERPYKQAWPLDAAVGLIREGRGESFDPAVVDRFLERLPAIRVIQRDYAEPEVET
jgi:putative two-component system response regulator